MPRKDPNGFDTIQREKFYPGSPKAVTAIRRGSKYGDQYAKEAQANADTIVRGSNADQAAYEASGGSHIPDTPASNAIVRRGAASIAADKVVNDIKDKDSRSKYAKLR